MRKFNLLEIIGIMTVIVVVIIIIIFLAPFLLLWSVTHEAEDRFGEIMEEHPNMVGFGGQVTKIVDGDTLWIGQEKVRLSLVNTPEHGEPGFQEAKDFALTVCPVGSNAELVVDLLQPKDKYGRSLGLVYCNDMLLNELLLTNGHAEISTYFCDKSEFGTEDWARAYGC
jgi:endonuclease YncB( thermonuclease family)